jgi:hypothetical protein
LMVGLAKLKWFQMLKKSMVDPGIPWRDYSLGHPTGNPTVLSVV